jgi:tyrosine-protein kinase Etk/Wzc
VFDVPESWLNLEFTLTARGVNRYHFSGGGQRLAFDGTVGQRYRVPTPEGMMEIKVDRLYANPGARFQIKRKSRLGTIQDIQTAMVISEQGKQSGVIQVKLQGENSKRIYALLSEIGREYMRQNLARKTEEAEKSLAFLNKQLPILKRQLEQSEDRYNQFRNTHGTVDLREEGRMSLAQATAARARRIELLQKKTELLARFTEDHPIVAAINRQRKEVDAEIDDINARIKTLPVLEQDEARLTRDIKVNTDLYTALSNTAQQLRLISVGRVSNVRLIDAPIAPEKPLKPNRPLIVALAVVTGLFLGALLAFARKALARWHRRPTKDRAPAQCACRLRHHPAQHQPGQAAAQVARRGRRPCPCWRRSCPRTRRSKACAASARHCNSRCRTSRTTSSCSLDPHARSGSHLLLPTLQRSWRRAASGCC